MKQAVVVSLIAITISLGSLQTTAQAGFFESGSVYSEKQFNDYVYAQWVWDNLKTLEQFSKEEGKYAADFAPWLERYKKDKQAALREMRSLPNGSPIKKGYDLQMAYDHWRGFVYRTWFDSTNKGKGTFEELLQDVAGKRQSDDCAKEYKAGTRPYLASCGPWPDWRDADDMQKEQAKAKKK